MNSARTFAWVVFVGAFSAHMFSGSVSAEEKLPASVALVLDKTQPLKFSRRGRLPMYVLPISGTLRGLDESTTRQALEQLKRRGIGYTVEWNPAEADASIREALRIARLQTDIGMPVAANANSCMYSFFDGTKETQHIDADTGERFVETSFGGALGCPFGLKHRLAPMKQRVEQFLKAYQAAGLPLDFVFADWEIDGPLEWNGAWQSSQRCQQCRDAVSDIGDFRAFQRRIRGLRSELQRVVLGDNVTRYFPQALVGNYAVYPHNGWRYWYDYFEHEAEGVPFQLDQRARYREWHPEFEATGFTFAMPVVYTWYPIFGWYDFAETDYRWFYNMLLVGSNAGQHTPASVPIIPFVHWHTTAPPAQPDASVQPMSTSKYQQLLWHLLLRGHDTFFLWCMPNELGKEVELVHQVYAASLQFQGFLDRGEPISFSVPQEPAQVVSGLRLGDRVLALRTDFGDRAVGSTTVAISTTEQIEVASEGTPEVVSVKQQVVDPRGRLSTAEGWQFPIGFYELPSEDDELRRMAGAGINLVRCGNVVDLDRVQAAGMQGWVSVQVQLGATEGLREAVNRLKDHPALAVWEGPDEIVWMFTAYSGLQRTAGFTRDDWTRQIPKAVNYANQNGKQIVQQIREGVQLVRKLDSRKRPFWINEAADSDLLFVRQYMDAIDITGCDYYAVRSGGSDLQSVGRLVDRWNIAGRGRPVWMVLQAFSWHTAHETRTRRYPSFKESRFMAYDTLVHGARGILYWGSNMIDDPEFRTSIYALTSELAQLNDFLIAPPDQNVHAIVVDDVFDKPGLGVRTRGLRHGDEYLLIVVNEDDHTRLGVDIRGLEAVAGRTLYQVYGAESARVEHGGFVTRLQPHQVKLFATNKSLVAPLKAGRDYVSPVPLTP